MDLNYLDVFRDNNSGYIYVPLPRSMWMENDDFCECEHCLAEAQAAIDKTAASNRSPSRSGAERVRRRRMDMRKAMQVVRAGALDTLAVPLTPGKTLMIHRRDLHSVTITTSERFYEEDETPANAIQKSMLLKGGVK